MPVFAGGGLSGLPFSRLAGEGDVLFLSGQVGIDRVTGRLDAVGVSSQTRVVLHNMLADLREVGLPPQQVARVTVFLVGSMDGANDVLACLGDVFTSPFPALTCVAVERLPHPDALVEVEMIVNSQL